MNKPRRFPALLIGLVGAGLWVATSSSQMGPMVGNWACGFFPALGGPSPYGTPLTLEQALAAAGRELKSADHYTSEVLEFTNHFYIEVREKASGQRAYALLVNRYSGTVSHEPTILWNSKYGMPGGPPRTGAALTVEHVRQTAQQFVSANFPDTRLGDDLRAFYGYYTLSVLRDERFFGMLSVHATTGQVWYHWWHGGWLGQRR